MDDSTLFGTNWGVFQAKQEIKVARTRARYCVLSTIRRVGWFREGGVYRTAIWPLFGAVHAVELIVLVGALLPDWFGENTSTAS